MEFITTERDSENYEEMDKCMSTEETCQKDPVCTSIFIGEKVSV